jgi:hypothetical protein
MHQTPHRSGAQSDATRALPVRNKTPRESREVGRKGTSRTPAYESAPTATTSVKYAAIMTGSGA